MKTFILFLDAFSSSDFKEENCPFLYNLAKKGVYGSTEIIPSCYHTEYSMLSGFLPLKHKVWSWYFLKKNNSSFAKIKPFLKILKAFEKNKKISKINRNLIDIYLSLGRMFEGKTRFLSTNKIPFDFLPYFDISVDKSYVDRNPICVPTLFDLLRKEKIKYSAMDYPTISGNKRTSFFFGKNDLKQLDKMKRLLKHNSVVYAHIWDLDAIEHKYGLHSKEAIEHIRKLDNKLKEIISSENEMNVVIFSDHGGCNVNKTRDILPIIKDYSEIYFIGSTNANIWLKDISKKEELKKRIKKEGYLVYDEKNIEKELKIPYSRDFVGDFMVAVKPGEQLYPDFFRDTGIVKSMHGYTGKTPELDGIFIINGFGLKPKKIDGMKLYDITPTILSAMKINIPEGCDGKPRV
jgi:predicted AlkP superfamily pyrophosphatase or phosphodiesterase